VFDSIYSDSVGAIVANDTLHPAVEHSDNILVFRIDVDQSDIGIAQPALFDFCLIAIVDDPTLCMEIRLLIQWHERAKRRWKGSRCQVIDDDVYHEIHAALMESRSQ
jgi:hypothetical protein